MGEIRNNKYNKSKCREIYKERKKCTKLPDEGPSLETSKILSYFSGRSIPNLLRRYLRSLYLNW